MIFDSRKEYLRWCELSLLEKAGKVTDLKRQVKFVLIPAQHEPDTIGKRGGVKRGKLIERECSYIADFTYTENGKLVVEDVKGFKTPEYRLKKKMLLYFQGIRIKET
jgi:hypothetical protein